MATKRQNTAKTKTKKTSRSALTAKQSVKNVKVIRPRITKKNNNDSLHKWNIGLAFLHALQGIAIIVISKSVSLPVNVHFLAVDTLASNAAGHTVLAPAVRHLLDINLAYLIATFFFISAIAHAVIATEYRNKYESNLNNEINKVRWVEYSLSAGIMIIAIGLLAGIYDASTLLTIFSLTVVMSLCGLIMEIHNQKTKTTNWLSYTMGSIAGLIPWLVIAIYLGAANAYGNGHVPAFVYLIYGSMFVLFFSFALNMYLQFKKKGKWADYIYAERVYMILSLVAKTVLAWQIFFGSLRP